jgi:hypothetical protein
MLNDRRSTRELCRLREITVKFGHVGCSLLTAFDIAISHRVYGSQHDIDRGAAQSP